uniref:Ig-like domain-containing protein n=1 Tax=Rhodnius prolixus TaxID=13249 RepID=T1I3V1_RHOPR
MENPLATYSPPEISMAAVGDMARLYCEAFVGYIDLPDATSEVIWTKEGNDTLNSPRVSVKKVQRENDQIIGGYLMIEDVNWSDFGTYVCTISNTGDQKIIMKTQLREKVVILMSHQLTEKWTRENISLVLDDIIASNYSSSYCVVLLEQLPEDSLNDYSAYLNRPHDKFILSAWDKEMISNGHPFWESNSASRAAQPKLRVVSSSVVITSAAPFRYLFMSRSQPNEVPV